MSHTDNEKLAMRSFMATMITVAWSFIGLRRQADFEQDAGRLNPLYVIAGGLIGTAFFIGILLTVVHLVVP